MRNFTLAFAITLGFIPTSCDIISPQRTFRFAVPSDYYYNLITSQLTPILTANGYRIETVQASSGIEANRLVANGQADLTLAFNHSIIMAHELGPDVGKVRTVFPLVSSVLFAFSKTPVTPRRQQWNWYPANGSASSS
ncbi:MAG: hypothetical protein JNL40_15350 [Cyclobacteriaceae bacterium]|nr:hypothetical protein [Cyclobacteriaceae bacterium]